MSSKKVYVIYYSMYGHVQTLARHVCKGLEKSGETLSDDILERMKAPSKANDVPIITPDQLTEADGFLFGMPTRFGMVPAQMKAFFDACGQLWIHNKISNKHAGMFFSTSTQAGGQETTALSTIPFFAHLGLIFVPIGSKPHKLADLSEIHGGSSYGCGTIAGLDNKRSPSKLELETAEFQGFDFGNLIKRIN